MAALAALSTRSQNLENVTVASDSIAFSQKRKRLRLGGRRFCAFLGRLTRDGNAYIFPLVPSIGNPYGAVRPVAGHT